LHRAEASLYRSTGQYRAALAAGVAPLGGVVVPQQIRPFDCGDCCALAAREEPGMGHAFGFAGKAVMFAIAGLAIVRRFVCPRVSDETDLPLELKPGLSNSESAAG
jgi:hypothetical protein